MSITQLWLLLSISLIASSWIAQVLICLICSRSGTTTEATILLIHDEFNKCYPIVRNGEGKEMNMFIYNQYVYSRKSAHNLINYQATVEEKNMVVRVE